MGGGHLQQLFLGAEARVGVAEAPLAVLLGDKLPPLLRRGIAVQLVHNHQLRCPELISAVIPQHNEELAHREQNRVKNIHHY